VIAWFFERTGLDKVWNTLMERHIPEAKGWKAWLFTLGSATMFVFSLQWLTGELLAMNYAPSPDHA